MATGEPAPDFSLPAVNRPGLVSLSDYRGKTTVLLALFRGLHCPFCRQQIAQLGVGLERLNAAGVEVVGVINTSLARATMFLRYRPARILLLADPDLATHRAYGLPTVEITVRGAEGDLVAHGAQLVGHFLVDRDGVVRWRYVEGAEHGGRATRFPSAQQLVSVAEGLRAADAGPCPREGAP